MSRCFDARVTALALAVVFAAYVFPGRTSLFDAMYTDAAFHVALFAFVGYLAFRAFGLRWPVCTALVAVSILSEIIQWLLGRFEFEWVDVVANAGGVVVSVVVFKLLRRRRTQELNS